MLAISFYFVNCVIISCKLSFNSRFTRNQIPIMSFLGFKKAELGCKMSELHLYVVKRQNWVVIIRKLWKQCTLKLGHQRGLTGKTCHDGSGATHQRVSQ